MRTNHQTFMNRAIKLAVKGGRKVAPNPMVGAVIVKNNLIIGMGYHKEFGGAHAEINAIESVKNKSQLKGSTIYITLEPCRHVGKTPPCINAIKAVGIERIIIGSKDPFQKGKRAKMEFIESEEAIKMNKFFFTWVTKKRPFITVKIAMSADGFVAGLNGKTVHFTTPKQDAEVHLLRAEHQAILVGSNTVINDDPLLTVRRAEGLNPLRIIIDSNGRTPKTAKVYKDNNFLKWKSHNLNALMRHLSDKGIASVFVEPGPTLYKILKRNHLIDELIIFRSEFNLEKGLYCGAGDGS